MVITKTRVAIYLNALTFTLGKERISRGREILLTEKCLQEYVNSLQVSLSISIDCWRAVKLSADRKPY